MKWDTLCQANGVGGLGIKNLIHMNQVSHAKLTWLYVAGAYVSVVKVLWAKYGSLLVEIKKGKWVSHTWQSI